MTPHSSSRCRRRRGDHATRVTLHRGRAVPRSRSGCYSIPEMGVDSLCRASLCRPWRVPSGYLAYGEHLLYWPGDRRRSHLGWWGPDRFRRCHSQLAQSASQNCLTTERVGCGAMTMTMLGLDSGAQRSWWKLILTGFLALVLGISAVLLPFNIMFRRILDVIFGETKPVSGSMTAVAVMLALVALVAVDGLINLFGAGVMNKRAARIRGVVGVAGSLAAIFLPGITPFRAA